MKGRLNFQTATYQCIRPGELWQCNWLEETGTIVSLVYDIPMKRITTMLGFSKGTPFANSTFISSSLQTLSLVLIFICLDADHVIRTLGVC